VDPDKTYQYRVQLVIENPNEGLNPKWLTETDLAKSLYLESSFSEPSNLATVISSSRILTQKVNPLPANRFWEGQTGSIASIAFDMTDNAEYVAANETISRGKVLNFLKKSGQKHETSVSGSAMSSMSGMGLGGMDSGTTPGRSGRQSTKAPVNAKTLDHISGVCVADIYGGKKLIGNSAEHVIPGQTVMMSFDGTLQIQTVDSDSFEWKRYDPSLKTQTSGMMGGMSGELL
jgi:hypothetical protein